MMSILSSGKEYFHSTINLSLRGIKNIQSHPVTVSIKQTINLSYKKTIEYGGHTYVVISKIPQVMQKNNKLAFGVIFTLNSIFFFIMNGIGSICEKQLNSKDDGQEIFKRRLIDMSVFVGTLVFNRYGVPALVNYHISRKTNLVISALMVLFRPVKNSLNKNNVFKVEIENLKKEIEKLRLQLNN